MKAAKYEKSTTFATKWRGKFALKKPIKSDPRYQYLWNKFIESERQIKEGKFFTQEEVKKKFGLL